MDDDSLIVKILCFFYCLPGDIWDFFAYDLPIFLNKFWYEKFTYYINKPAPDTFIWKINPYIGRVFFRYLTFFLCEFVIAAEVFVFFFIPDRPVFVTVLAIILGLLIGIFLLRIYFRQYYLLDTFVMSRYTWGKKYDISEELKGFEDDPSDGDKTEMFFFANCKTKQEAKSMYRKYCKIYHPDQETGSKHIFEMIEMEYKDKIENIKFREKNQNG